MALFNLHEAEKTYIIHGIQENIRCDGRGCLDYRFLEIETGIIENCDGSCLLKLGETKFIAGVRADLAAPRSDAADKGWIEISIENTPHAHAEFEGRFGEEFFADVPLILNQVCNDDRLIDLKSLCVIPGQQVWAVYVDIMVLGYGGNYIDCASIVTKAALFDTKIQSATVKYDEENEPVVEISDDPYEVFSIDVHNLPLLITLNRIGSEWIVDATCEEEACTICRVVVAVSSEEMVLVRQVGSPGSLHIGSLNDGTEIAEKMGINLQKSILESLNKEKTLYKRKKGFF